MKLLNEKDLKLQFSRSAELIGEITSDVFGVATATRGFTTNWLQDFSSGVSIFVFSNYDMIAARPISEAVLEYNKQLSSNPNLKKSKKY